MAGFEVVDLEVADFEAVDFEVVPRVSEWAVLGLVEHHLGELELGE